MLDSSIEKSLSLYNNEIITNAVVISVGFSGEFATICWMIPAGFHEMTFSDEINIPSGKYWMPTTIFKLEDNDLSVLVAAEDIWEALIKFKLPKYQNLYYSPYLNMISNTNNCMGTAIPREEMTTINEIINAWTTNFFAARFNSLSRLLKTPIHKYYENARNKTNFDETQYKKYKGTLEDFCEKGENSLR
jgi:hypothetical protein